MVDEVKETVREDLEKIEAPADASPALKQEVERIRILTLRLHYYREVAATIFGMLRDFRTEIATTLSGLGAAVLGYQQLRKKVLTERIEVKKLKSELSVESRAPRARSLQSGTFTTPVPRPEVSLLTETATPSLPPWWQDPGTIGFGLSVSVFAPLALVLVKKWWKRPSGGNHGPL